MLKGLEVWVLKELDRPPPAVAAMLASDGESIDPPRELSMGAPSQDD
jgi:hypothetical protein